MPPSPQQIVNSFEALKRILVQEAIEYHLNTDRPRIRIRSRPHWQVVVDEPASLASASSLKTDEHLVVRQTLFHSIAAVNSPAQASKAFCRGRANHWLRLRAAQRSQRYSQDNVYASPQTHPSG